MKYINKSRIKKIVATIMSAAMLISTLNGMTITSYAAENETESEISNMHTVRFMDGEEEISVQSVENGSVLTMIPEVSPKTGYTLIGWYPNVKTFEDLYSTEKFDFNTPITEDITLSALWVARMTVDCEGVGNFIVKYDWEDPEEVNPEDLATSMIINSFLGFYTAGATITAVPDEDWKFVEWRNTDTNETYSTEPKIHVTVTENVNLVAVFEFVEEETPIVTPETDEENRSERQNGSQSKRSSGRSSSIAMAKKDSSSTENKTEESTEITTAKNSTMSSETDYFEELMAADKTQLTRGEIVGILFKMANVDDTNYQESPFVDVKKGDYELPIAWAAEKGIVNGYNSTEFGVNDFITREQVITILYRYATEFKGYDYDISSKNNVSMNMFADSEDISTYAITPMEWAVNNGFLLGRTNHTLDPHANITRAECKTILERFAARYGEAAK